MMLTRELPENAPIQLTGGFAATAWDPVSLKEQFTQKWKIQSVSTGPHVMESQP